MLKENRSKPPRKGGAFQVTNGRDDSFFRGKRESLEQESKAMSRGESKERKKKNRLKSRVAPRTSPLQDRRRCLTLNLACVAFHGSSFATSCTLPPKNKYKKQMGVHSAQNTQRRRGRRNRRSSVAPFGPLSQTSRLSRKSDPGKELDALPTGKGQRKRLIQGRAPGLARGRGLGNHRKGELILKRKLSQGHRRPLIHRPP